MQDEAFLRFLRGQRHQLRFGFQNPGCNRMNEADSVFSKEVSLVEVPYVESLFLGSLDVKSMIQKSIGI